MACSCGVDTRRRKRFPSNTHSQNYVSNPILGGCRRTLSADMTQLANLSAIPWRKGRCSCNRLCLCHIPTCWPDSHDSRLAVCCHLPIRFAWIYNRSNHSSDIYDYSCDARSVCHSGSPITYLYIISRHRGTHNTVETQRKYLTPNQWPRAQVGRVCRYKRLLNESL